jgi:hypothetical protein
MFERILLSSGSDNGGPFWVATYGTALADNVQIQAAGIVVDASLNVYVAAQGQVELVKFSKTGSIDWQNRFTNQFQWFMDSQTAGGRVQGKTLCVDAANNIYGRYKPNNSTYWGSFRINAAAAKSWERLTEDCSRGGWNAVDTSGRLHSYTGTPNSMMHVSSTSDGTSIARFIITESAGWNVRPYNVAFNNAGWGTSFGVVDRGSNGNYIYLQWWLGGSVWTSRVVGLADGTPYTFLNGRDCAFDNNYNSILIGNDGATPSGSWVGSNSFLSSAFNWTTRFVNCQLYQVVTDSANNIIVAGSLNSGGVFVAKLNLNGVVQWQRRLTISGYSQLEAFNVATDTIGNIYLGINGYTTTGNTMPVIVAKLPSDGTLTGTYGDITYASHSATVGTGPSFVDKTGQSGGNMVVTQSDNPNNSYTNAFIPMTRTSAVVTLS